MHPIQVWYASPPDKKEKSRKEKHWDGSSGFREVSDIQGRIKQHKLSSPAKAKALRRQLRMLRETSLIIYHHQPLDLIFDIGLRSKKTIWMSRLVRGRNQDEIRFDGHGESLNVIANLQCKSRHFYWRPCSANWLLLIEKP